MPEPDAGPRGPLYPRLSPPYKVHWNWELLLPCNYRCSYCVVHNEKAPHLKLSLAEWESIWSRLFRLYGCGQVRFAGGEPTIYPGFIELVSMLLEMHTVDLTTNLSFDVGEWVRKVPAEGIAISGSLHPEHTTPEEFLRKLLALRDRGNRLISASIVAYPSHLRMIEPARELFEKNQVLFKIIPFNGVHDGKRYPAAYTEEEKALLGMQVAKSQDELGKAINQRWQDYANSKPEDKDFQGISCHMGEMYAKIYPDGTVRRCCHPDVAVLGRITDPDLRLFDEPRPCTTPRCSCWKAMVAGRYETQVDTLWQSPDHPRHPLKAPEAESR